MLSFDERRVGLIRLTDCNEIPQWLEPAGCPNRRSFVGGVAAGVYKVDKQTNTIKSGGMT
jgi:hypothetical protein